MERNALVFWYGLMLLLVVYSQGGCSTLTPEERVDSLFTITENVDHYYDLSAPQNTHRLPEKLREVSGISYMNPESLLCVEDENGVVYVFSLLDGKITSKRKFADDGDYEDLVYKAGTVFILKSNGTLYRFFLNDDGKSKVFKTPLGSKSDTEGLGYDPVSGNLLIACKERVGLDGEKTKGNDVYQFAIEKEKLLKTPFLSLTSKKLKTFLEANRSYEYDADRIVIKPSGIAFNPLDKYYYIIASVGKMMIVVDQAGAIKATYSIPKDLLAQPEGITFGPSGDLWISSEGKSRSGRILHYQPIRR